MGVATALSPPTTDQANPLLAMQLTSIPPREDYRASEADAPACDAATGATYGKVPPTWAASVGPDIPAMIR